jgi:hypothetical protein
MKAPENFDSVKAQEGLAEFPKAGGYALRCCTVEETESRAGNPMIVFDFDISQGDFRNYYSKRFASNQNANKKWPLRYYQLVNEEQAGRYKGVIESFRKSNPSFPSAAFSGPEHDLKALIGLEIGGVLQEEEYEKQDGSVGAILKIFYLTSVETAMKPDVSVPKKKCLKVASEPARQTKSPDDLPFD